MSGPAYKMGGTGTASRRRDRCLEITQAAPIAAQAQGIIGGGRHEAAVGHRAAGPVGGVVGAVVGGAVGGVKGVIGVPQHTRYARRYR
jgi:hypothetical protein